jgi:hypothetical protein
VRTAALLGVTCVVLGIAISYATLRSDRLPELALTIGLAAIFVAISAVGFARLRDGLRAGRGYAFAPSMFLGAGLVVAVLLPGIQLISGARLSKLGELGFEVADVPGSVARAYGYFVLAIVAFVGGESVHHVLRAKSPVNESSRARWFRDPRAYVILIGVGFAAYLAFRTSRQEAFTTRAQSGEGIKAALSYALPAGVAMGIIERHWGSRPLAVVSVVAVGLIVSQGNRTPLFLIAIALILRLVSRSLRPGKTWSTIVVLGIVFYIGATVLVGISSWRGNTALGLDVSLASSLQEAGRSPFSQLSQGGLDTLDGMILSLQVDGGAVGAKAWDPAKAVLNFVPRQLWPDKPGFLGPVVSSFYTNFGGNAGLFLSGPGYASILYGIPGLLVVFALMGAGSGYLLRKATSAPVLAVVVIYGAVRFMFAGDVFDIHNALLLAGVLSLAAGGAFLSDKYGLLPKWACCATSDPSRGGPVARNRVPSSMGGGRAAA